MKVAPETISGVWENRGSLLGVLITRASYYWGGLFWGVPYFRKLPLKQTSRLAAESQLPESGMSTKAASPSAYAKSSAGGVIAKATEGDPKQKGTSAQSFLGACVSNKAPEPCTRTQQSPAWMMADSALARKLSVLRSTASASSPKIGGPKNLSPKMEIRQCHLVDFNGSFGGW